MKPTYRILVPIELNYYRLEAGRFEDFVSYGLKSFAHDGESENIVCRLLTSCRVDGNLYCGRLMQQLSLPPFPAVNKRPKGFA
jgi:hypothetical protein